MVSYGTSSRMLSARDVANILSIHINTVRRWGDQGVIKVYRIGPRHDRRFRLQDINHLLTTQSNRTKNAYHNLPLEYR